MSHRRIALALVPLLVLALGSGLHPEPAAAADPPPSHAHGGPPAGAAILFDNLGDYHRAITTRSVTAQRWFDQGLRLMWAFNLEEAQRSFEEATRQDPTSAICFWGVAMSLGPHINLPALPERTVAAHHAAQKALALAGSASEVERALIQALVHRYSDPAPTDPAVQFGLDSSYAAAMAEVARRFPDDDDVVAFSAEAAMNVHPWDYWKSDGTPQPWTTEIVTTLERLLARNPRHPGVNHYYIHMVEASPHPERAVKSADLLVDAMPGAGHLVHMPSHIYERLGRFEASAEANRRAVESDKTYLARAKPQGFYNMYAAHNHHFLAWTSTKQGRRALAIRKARDAAAAIPVEMMRAMPGMDIFPAAVPSALARFGRWDEILAEKPVEPAFAYLNGVWHYARGLALIAKGRIEPAAAERDSLAAIAAAVPPELTEALNPARSLLAIALGILDGALAEKRGNVDEAVRAMTEAVRQDDGLRYDEPHDWFTPARVYLGGVLLRAGRAPQAEAVFREDLKRNPGHGWSLFGLAESLRAQKKADEAAAIERQFKEAWTGADHVPSVAGL